MISPPLPLLPLLRWYSFMFRFFHFTMRVKKVGACFPSRCWTSFKPCGVRYDCGGSRCCTFLYTTMMLADSPDGRTHGLSLVRWWSSPLQRRSSSLRRGPFRFLHGGMTRRPRLPPPPVRNRLPQKEEAVGTRWQGSGRQWRDVQNCCSLWRCPCSFVCPLRGTPPHHC